MMSSQKLVLDSVNELAMGSGKCETGTANLVEAATPDCEFKGPFVFGRLGSLIRFGTL